jgi:UDP-3-O-[3-hydroxymyristoyl] N-acetylglucosamine deacetylase
MIGDLKIAAQKTLKAAIHCRGVGLHSGRKVAMRLCPAAPDTGIVFRRVDEMGAEAEIAALWSNALPSSLCTRLGNGEGVEVATIEHLMAAFSGAEVDNALVELDGPEVPIMDGSAAPFLFLIECAGVVEQDAPRRAIKVLDPVLVEAEGKSAALLPDDGFSVSFEIDYDDELIRHQDVSFLMDSSVFKTEVSRARTYGFLHEVEHMRRAGLARGGSLENAVVVAGDRVLNEGGLRYADEFVRHKVLDAVGDLALAGAPILGHFRGVRSGHDLNRQLLEALFAKPESWCMTTLSHGALIGGEPEWQRRPAMVRAS